MHQAPKLYAAIRRSRTRGLTYMDLLRLGVSVCPWKRLSESTEGLRSGEKLERAERDGRVVFRIARG